MKPQDERNADSTNRPDMVVLKLYVNSTHYLEVDTNGYVCGVAEGNAGCVLALHDSRNGQKFALKIPRLRAATLTENFNLTQIAEDELKNVVLAHMNGGGNGLVRKEALDDVLLRRRECTHSVFNDTVLFVQFDSLRPEPRIIAVKERDEHDKDLCFLPEGVVLSAEEKTAILEFWGESQAHKREHPFDAPGYILTGVKGDRTGLLEGEAFDLREQTDASKPRSVWFYGVPSIVYQWAEGTLQAAIGEGLTKEWLMPQYCDLLEAIANGVETLHERGLLHCDLRPANVMWREGGGREADKYLVNDYGSFSIDGARPDSKAAAASTLLGAGLASSGGRVSPFYARERREAIQRESAEVAILVDRASRSSSAHSEWVLRLGWKAQLFSVGERLLAVPSRLSGLTASDAEAVREAIIGEIDESTKERDEKKLGAGDRIRVRDFVFTVKTATDLGARGLLVVCAGNPSVIHHDKVVIRNQRSGREMDGKVISIPSYSEYYTWTAATDVYSIGAIALYCPFMNSKLFKGELPQVTSLRLAEQEFDEFFQLVTNEEYFRVVWDQLSCFRHTLKQIQDREDEEGEGMTVEDVRRFVMSDKGGSGAVDYAIKIVREIVQVVPHVRDLLACFPALNRSSLVPLPPSEKENVNIGDFLLYLYFAMGCLHRRSHFVRKSTDTDPAPFCMDRFENPTEVDFVRLRKDSGYRDLVKKLNAVSRCLSVLTDELRNFLKKTWMRAFDVPLGDIPPRSGKMTHQALLDKLELEKTQAAWRERAKSVLGEAEGLFDKRLIPSKRESHMKALLQDIADTANLHSFNSGAVPLSKALDPGSSDRGKSDPVDKVDVNGGK